MNSLENKVPDSSTSIQKNQYNTDKWSLEKTIGDVENKTPNVSCWVNSTVLDTKIGDVEKQISDTNGLVTTACPNTKIGEVENKIPDDIGLVKKTNIDKKILCDFWL